MTLIPGSFNYIIQQSVQFNNPVSEASLAAIGASVNGLLSILMPVGSVYGSMLSEAQMNTQLGNPSPATWVLADGRSASGTLYNTVTGNATVPDLRGVFLRGKNYSRSGTTGNPDGDLPVGTYQADGFTSHNHQFAFGDPGHNHAFSPNAMDLRVNNYQSYGGVGLALSAYDASGGTPNGIGTSTTGISITFNANGGNETRARNVTLNWFIRVN